MLRCWFVIVITDSCVGSQQSAGSEGCAGWRRQHITCLSLRGVLEHPRTKSAHTDTGMQSAQISCLRKAMVLIPDLTCCAKLATAPSPSLSLSSPSCLPPYLLRRCCLHGGIKLQRQDGSASSRQKIRHLHLSGLQLRLAISPSSSPSPTSRACQLSCGSQS